MTSVALTRADKFRIGRVFSNTFSIIGRNIGLCVGLAALFSGLPLFILTLMRLNAHPVDAANFAAASANFKIGYFVGAVVFWILYLALAFLLQSSLVRAAIEDLQGKRPTFGDCIQIAIRFLPQTVGVGLLVGLGVGLASVALLVPGIILGLSWSMAVPVLIQERLGVFGSMSRSRALTKGSRWSLFGLFLVIIIIAFVIQTIGGVIIYLFHGMVAAFLAALVQSVISIIASVATAVGYVELRQVKEGASVDELVEVFS